MGVGGLRPLLYPIRAPQCRPLHPFGPGLPVAPRTVSMTRWTSSVGRTGSGMTASTPDRRAWSSARSGDSPWARAVTSTTAASRTDGSWRSRVIISPPSMPRIAKSVTITSAPRPAVAAAPRRRSGRLPRRTQRPGTRSSRARGLPPRPRPVWSWGRPRIEQRQCHTLKSFRNSIQVVAERGSGEKRSSAGHFRIKAVGTLSMTALTELRRTRPAARSDFRLTEHTAPTTLTAPWRRDLRPTR